MITACSSTDDESQYDVHPPVIKCNNYPGEPNFERHIQRLKLRRTSFYVVTATDKNTYYLPVASCYIKDSIDEIDPKN